MKIDVVISDNRFGLWNKSVKTIFVTHQLMIKMPTWAKFLEKVVHRFNIFFVKKFDHCWIPDFEGQFNISGNLSHRFALPPSAKFIGALSRFSLDGKQVKIENPPNVLLILSGLEPQRSILEQIVLEQLEASKYSAVVLRGKPKEKTDYRIKGKIQVLSHLPAQQMKQLMLSAKHIICRSGYSSLMDLASIKRNAILIPTPGQTEQEYLAQLLKDTKQFYSIAQHKFKLEEAIAASKNYHLNLPAAKLSFTEKVILHDLTSDS